MTDAQGEPTLEELPPTARTVVVTGGCPYGRTNRILAVTTIGLIMVAAVSAAWAARSATRAATTVNTVMADHEKSVEPRIERLTERTHANEVALATLEARLESIERSNSRIEETLAVLTAKLRDGQAIKQE